MTDVNTAGQVGLQTLADGVIGARFRQGRNAEQVVQDLHGRFYEQNFRGNMYSDGIGLTSISNTTFTTNTLGATCTPIAGLWNPSTNNVNLVVLSAALGITVTAATATGGSPFVWALSVGNTAISTGSAPLNRKSLANSGSIAKGMSGVACTGQTNALVVKFGSALGGGVSGNFSFVGTAVGDFTMAAGMAEEHFDGSLIVPPGGLLALLATTTPVAHSAVSAIVWEEVAV